MERGFLTGLAMNGAGIVHDFELAFCGQTSEDVDAGLGSGAFGMARETGELVNRAITEGDRDGLGLGAAVGRFMERRRLKHRRLSLLATAWRLGVPTTVHVAVGTDIVHMHPACDGATLGEASMADFRHVCKLVHGLDGGVWMNIGCAVVLPEVFLKAVSVAINLGSKLEGMTTANLDMIRQYRAETNVVQRPPGRGISLIGQHELLLPLLRMALLAKLDEKGWKP
jgi:hypothetical protein